MSNIDYEKLFDQEPEFRQFVADAMFSVMRGEPGFEDVIKSMYAMYAAGIDRDQMAAFLKRVIKS